MRMQVTVPEDLMFDLVNYCKENGLKYTDVVRSLIRIEIYQEQAFAKKKPFRGTTGAHKVHKNHKNYPSDRLADL